MASYSGPRHLQSIRALATWTVFALVLLSLVQTAVHAANGQFELSEVVQLDRADGAALAHLERARACLADRQWDEAVETLRQLGETSEGKLLSVSPSRLVNLSDACQMQLAALPAPALKLYRSRVDAVAQKWYEDGAARRDAKLLGNVVQQAFASSWGDKALMALGEICLEQGDFTAARWCWERILPVQLPPGEANTWPGYPDTTLDLAAVRARLVVVSILEGSTARAHEELSQFVRLHGEARGRLAGREVRYAAALAELLNQSTMWPQGKPSTDWPTFAGSPARNAIAPDLTDVAGVDWRIVLKRPAQVPAAATEPRPLGVADDPAAPLVFHPVLDRDHLFVADMAEVFGYQASTGRAAWGDGNAVIYREPWDAPPPVPVPSESLGVPRFTQTVADGRLYVRIGSPATNPPQQLGASSPAGSLLCFDLRAEGKLVMKLAPEEGWAFEGAPVVNGARLYVAMRRSDIRPQAHVACFDLPTGRLRWRRFVCAAETPARGSLWEITSNLLTFAGGTIYFNTNLGAVAALSADDGRIAWVTLYPRVRNGSLIRLEPHWQRDLNPCLFDRGKLYVAPADCRQVLAMEAATGQILWPGTRAGQPVDSRVQDPLDDVVHLLGVAGDCLIAGGHRLYWINLGGERPGQIAHIWPEGSEKLGFGRGLVTGDSVLFPTREKIYIFDSKTARMKKAIDLAALGAQGGNLLVADGRLLIATATEIIALRRGGGPKKEVRAELTLNTGTQVDRTRRVRKDDARRVPATIPADAIPPINDGTK